MHTMKQTQIKIKNIMKVLSRYDLSQLNIKLPKKEYNRILAFQDKYNANLQIKKSYGNFVSVINFLIGSMALISNKMKGLYHPFFAAVRKIYIACYMLIWFKSTRQRKFLCSTPETSKPKECNFVRIFLDLTNS